ncbi:hypothetical protein DCAR_0415718 [Daucus carota subsp. sativus]|uniref:Lipase n=1 Tax=Daucus carota subsp. sativus TaxID=79200 RepID=A0AAF0WX96_DAUCS|nr:hypothetical protein DCAR_0415718 [Daucus carota subsp. sativus]
MSLRILISSSTALLAILVIALSYQASASPPTKPASTEAVAGICSAAEIMHGYKCQEYDVTTADGYILSLQRFPQGKNGGGGMNKQPVLLQHGVLVDGMTWLLNSADQSLALILADNGYDVWIANTRGTRFSRRHVSLDPSNPDFWDWTWDELVAHDLPAAIDFVFKQTGQKIHYVGHSMGTLIALTSFSEGKQVDKVKSAALLSPIAYLSHMTTALGILAARAFVGEVRLLCMHSYLFAILMNIHILNRSIEPVANFLKVLCLDPKVNCFDLITALTGKNCCLNTSTVELFLKNEPQSTSTKNMVHLAQTFRNGRLAKYDYGSANFNTQHYGDSEPPVYNLANIPRDLPLFLSYGGQDSLSDVKDVENLLDNLKLHDVDKINIQYIKDFAHADFIMGTTSKDIVYNQIMAFFKRHT